MNFAQKLRSLFLPKTSTAPISLYMPEYATYQETTSGSSRYITSLGTLDNYPSYAGSVNERGQVVGHWKAIDGETHAFLWSKSEGLIDLGTLGSLDYNEAKSINNKGQIVGCSKTACGYEHAFLWNPHWGMQDLGTLGGLRSYAYDINDNDLVVGAATLDSDRSDFHAFLWSKCRGMTDLGTLGGNYSEAKGINDSGQVIGSAEIHNGDWHAFIWSKKSGMRDLGTLGGSYSWAKSINSDGFVVGAATLSQNNWHSHAFLWSEADGMQDLGTLGGCHSYAYSINQAGQIVGSSDTNGKAPHAFLWENGVMIDLNCLIPPDSGWELRQALHITDSGHILGYGCHNGQIRTFLLTPTHEVPSIERSLLAVGSGVC